MKTVQVKRLKELEKENGRLKKAVADLIIDKLIFVNKHAIMIPYQQRKMTPDNKKGVVNGTERSMFAPDDYVGR